MFGAARGVEFSAARNHHARPKPPDLETSLRIQRPQPVQRSRSQHVDERSVEEGALRQTEIRDCRGGRGLPYLASTPPPWPAAYRAPLVAPGLRRGRSRAG